MIFSPILKLTIKRTLIILAIFLYFSLSSVAVSPKKGIKNRWLGLFVQNFEKKKSGIKSIYGGVVIVGAMDRSPAVNNRLQVGDIIVRFNGKRISNIRQLNIQLKKINIGRKARCVIIRDNKRISTTLMVTFKPSRGVYGNYADKRVDYLGIRGVELNENNSYTYGIIDNRGVVIEKVMEGSPSERSGIIEGDLIKEVAGKPVDNLKEYRNLLKRNIDNKNIQFIIKRRNREEMIMVSN